MLSPLSLILESVLQTDQQLMAKTKAKVFSALMSVLQMLGLDGMEGNNRCVYLGVGVCMVYQG
jgi:hypothetical protein